MKNYRFLLIAVCLGLLVGVATAAAIQHSFQNDNNGKKIALEKIIQSSGTSVTVENSSESPLIFQQALSKEITGVEFAALTGISSESANYSSFPDVVLINGSNQRVKKFTLALKNAATGNIDLVTVSDRDIAPGATFSVPLNWWVQPERITSSKDGKAQSAYQRVSIESPKAWLPLRTGEIAVMVAEVEYESGQKWQDSRKQW